MGARAAAASACCSARAACSRRSAAARRLRSGHGLRGARGVESASPGPASRTLTVPVSGGGGGGDQAGTVRGGSAGSGQRTQRCCVGAAPRGSLCKWMNPECPCLYPLGESRRRCAEPPPWRTPVRVEIPRALSAFAATGRPSGEDAIPRETVYLREGKGGLWCCLSGRPFGNIGEP